MLLNNKSIEALANGYGLTLEPVVIPGHDNALKVYKGAAMIFTGTEEAVQEFLVQYEKHRPDPYAGSMYGYKE